LVRAVALKVGEDSPARCGSAQESETHEGYALSRADARENYEEFTLAAVENHPSEATLTQPARRLSKAAQTTGATPGTINEKD
jgi:hypothetical protein